MMPMPYSGALVLWFCGLSGAGKSTVADAVKNRLTGVGRSVLVLDGDDVREKFNVSLGFSEADIIANNAFIAKLCMENSDAYDVIIVPIISPLDHARRSARQQIGPRFRLVWCRAPIKVVAGRDVKGLYAMARQGKIQDLVGFSETGVAFEEPSDADLTLDTGNETQEKSAETLHQYICAQLESFSVGPFGQHKSKDT